MSHSNRYSGHDSRVCCIFYYETRRSCLGTTDMTVVSRNVKPTTHAHTGILLHCGGVQIPKLKKTDTEYLRLKIEPNRTEFEKSKLIQPYRWMIISVWCYHGRGLEYCIRPILLLLLPAGLRRCCCEVEMLKSNFLDNRLPKRKKRFLFDYRFSHCTIPPHCDSHLNATSFDPV